MTVAACARAVTYQVGPARTYHAVGSLPALNPGDVVEIDPATYYEVKRWTRPGTAAQPIIVRGVGAVRPVFDATGLTVDGAMPNPRAVFQVEADFITLENLEFQNARNGDNGAGIRVSLTSYWNERKAHETWVVPISSGYTLGFRRGREERCQAQFL